MIEIESYKIALDYIKESGKVTSAKLVEYMNCPKVKFSCQCSEPTTRYTIIPQLKESGKIKLIKGRHGQADYLVYNDKNWFEHLNEQIDNMVIHHRQQRSQYRQYPEARERNLRITLWNLARINKHIKNEIDKQYLNQKIINLLLTIGYNKEVLASEIDNEIMYWDVV